MSNDGVGSVDISVDGVVVGIVDVVNHRKGCKGDDDNAVIISMVVMSNDGVDSFDISADGIVVGVVVVGVSGVDGVNHREGCKSDDEGVGWVMVDDGGTPRMDNQLKSLT